MLATLPDPPPRPAARRGACVLRCPRTRSAGWPAGGARDARRAGRGTILRFAWPTGTRKRRCAASARCRSAAQFSAACSCCTSAAPPSACPASPSAPTAARARRAPGCITRQHTRADRRHPMCKTGCLLLTLEPAAAGFRTRAAAAAAPRVREIVAECGGWQRDGRRVVRRDGGGGDARAAARRRGGRRGRTTCYCFSTMRRARRRERCGPGR